MKLVETHQVHRAYRLGNQEVSALRGVSLTVERGEFLAIAGPSGSGKSTLLNLIGCIDKPTRGDIYLAGKPINRLSADQLSELRLRHIGFVFQTFNLLPVLSAWENVEYPLLHRKDITKAERRARIAHYLKVVGLSNHAHHRPNELSGGQRQRVAIARALATRPRIVLADEPTANLDHKTGERIIALMKHINRVEKTTFIFATHDPTVMAMANRIVHLQDGEIVTSRPEPPKNVEVGQDTLHRVTPFGQQTEVTSNAAPSRSK